ncbi:hypothetical protein MNB_SM-4-731 [hydrothermal vent metagenome]|jgi:hypothetical protein|uniref:Uncharacterized protein n=1 Tax=hydrothermal vent metagenome TaxID=652676 RepID=A0A1W1CPD1_9ZZZZ|nr:MAG: hypothetical protein SPLUMA1_SPLUMAMAG1_01089 [uncultured Sulfurimonas sp.]CAI6155459.1 MAG: hypothetical protein SPLUMA2_SPLUMAMAG2_00549 [uncultured Sulfurimonas sp.]
MDSVFEMVKLITFMMFISSVGGQAWIAVLDVVGHFSQALEKFRPAPVQDKYSRIVVVIGLMVWYLNTNEVSFVFGDWE